MGINTPPGQPGQRQIRRRRLAGQLAKPARPLVFVGFDASEPLVDAMRQGKIHGLVVQNPLRMGKLSVLTMVKHLEKQTVEKQISTGETLVTPENMNDPDIAPLIHPPQADNSSDASLSGSRSKKYRVIVIPKGTTHEFWKTLHAGTLEAAKELGNVEVIWQGPQKEDDRVLQIQLVQNAVAAGVDGIVIAPLDSRALVEPIEAAIAKGIPVLIYDSALESAKLGELRRRHSTTTTAACWRRSDSVSYSRVKDGLSCFGTQSAPKAPSSVKRVLPTLLRKSSPRSF